MPMRSASLFMRSTNAGSDPAMASASAMQASFPDWMIIPCSSSSTVTGFLGSMNMREPETRQARSETAIVCPERERPLLERREGDVRRSSAW